VCVWASVSECPGWGCYFFISLPGWLVGWSVGGGFPGGLGMPRRVSMGRLSKCCRCLSNGFGFLFWVWVYFWDITKLDGGYTSSTSGRWQRKSMRLPSELGPCWSANVQTGCHLYISNPFLCHPPSKAISLTLSLSERGQFLKTLLNIKIHDDFQRTFSPYNFVVGPGRYLGFQFAMLSSCWGWDGRPFLGGF